MDERLSRGTGLCWAEEFSVILMTVSVSQMPVFFHEPSGTTGS